MRGRKPEPTHVKKAKGVRPSRINEHEPEFPIGSTRPPDSVKAEPYALKEWHRIVPLLRETDLYKESDRTALEVFCVTYAEWRRAVAYLRRNGRTVITPKGYVQQRPEVGIASQTAKLVKDFCAEFGLTPSSRSRVKAGKAKKKGKHATFFGDDENESVAQGQTLPN